MSEELHFPPEEALKLEPHLPPPPSTAAGDGPPQGKDDLPFLTLTFATSLDSSLSLAPGVRTTLSGPQSKAMTHFLRSRHAAILIGAGTAVADDPGLNCRIAAPPSGGEIRQPRPIVLDPRGRWDVGDASKVLRLASEGLGLAPFVVVGAELRDGGGVRAPRKEALERHGGKYIFLETAEGGRFAWPDVLRAVKREGLDSIMVEGGGHVINSLLVGANKELVDSVIVTIAPTWLGTGGVVVSPDRTDKSAAAARLTNVSWHPLGEDVVMCGKLL